MRDLETKLEKLRVDAADCDLISKLATDHAKRDLFARMSRRLLDMAIEIEALIAAKKAVTRADKTGGTTGEKSGDA
jgi:hypothetical protein